MNTIQAKGITLSMETEPGPGVFRDVAECVDFSAPLTVGSERGPLNAERFQDAMSFLSSGQEFPMTVNWLTKPDITVSNEPANGPCITITVRWRRPIRRIHLRRYLAKLRHELQSPEAKRLERATRVRPLRKKIRRFK